MTPSTVIFDFDGTLVKTREASWRLFQRTNAEFDLGVDRPEDFYALFRRNFYAALDEVCSGDPARLDRVRAHFLQLLRDEYSPDLVPGMGDVIHRLAGSCTLVLASSNTMESVRRTMERHGLACCFAHAFTGDLEPDKAASIRCFLADPGYSMRRLCEPEYTEECAAVAQQGDEVVLVTDTVGDVEEAIRCGIRAVGVVWGMHTADELLAAGAEFVAIWPQELLTHLLDDPTVAVTCAVARTAAPPAVTPVLDQARRAAATRRRQRVAAASALGSHGCGCESCAVPVVGSNGNGVSAAPVAVDPMLRDAVARLVWLSANGHRQ
ncbi:MAG TPA: HAD family hydrolase [Candidatus Dormibacteraeota bacterium]